MKFSKFLLLPILFGFFFVACNKPVDEPTIEQPKTDTEKTDTIKTEEQKEQEQTKTPTSIDIFGEDFAPLDPKNLPLIKGGEMLYLTAKVSPADADDPTITWSVEPKEIVEGEIQANPDGSEVSFALKPDFAAEEFTVKAISNAKAEVAAEITLSYARLNSFYEYFRSANVDLMQSWILTGFQDRGKTQAAYLTFVDNEGNTQIATDGSGQPIQNIYFPIITEKVYGKTYNVSFFSYYDNFANISFEARFDDKTNEIVFFTQECNSTFSYDGQNYWLDLCAILDFGTSDEMYFKKDNEIEIMRGKPFLFDLGAGQQFDGILFTHNTQTFDQGEATIAGAILGVDFNTPDNFRGFIDSPIFYPYMVDLARPVSAEIHAALISPLSAVKPVLPSNFCLPNKNAHHLINFNLNPSKK